MKAAVDVCYESDRAVAACVVFNDWSDSEPAALVREVLPAAARYRSGRFFERELQPVLSRSRGVAAAPFPSTDCARPTVPQSVASLRQGGPHSGRSVGACASRLEP